MWYHKHTNLDLYLIKHWTFQTEFQLSHIFSATRCHTTPPVSWPIQVLCCHIFYSILSINYVIVKNGTNPGCFQSNNTTVYGHKYLNHQFTDQMVYYHSYRIVRLCVHMCVSVSPLVTEAVK